MKRAVCYFVLCICITSGCFSTCFADELDRVSIYLNGKLLGTWRDGDEQVLHIDSIAATDTLTFFAQTDIGGLQNCSIDMKDDAEAPIESILAVKSAASEALFVYTLNIKKVKSLVNKGTNSLQVVLNMAPERNIPPRTVASVSLVKLQK